MNTAERIVRHYGGDWHGNQGNIPGDGHSKYDRSVSVKDAPDRPDGILVCVRGTGDWKAELDRFRRDGLLPWFEPARRVEPMFRQPRPAGVSHFSFRNAQGEVVCRKVRTDHENGTKSFGWQHPDGNGGWKAGRGGEALFYRLPELLAAPADAVVYVAEGERKADKLADWGLVATSSKDIPADLSPLEGRTVVILPDNDMQGRAIADGLALKLQRIARRVLTIELPGLPDKGDIIDWTGDLAELEQLVDRALKPQLLPLADLTAWANTPPQPTRFTMAGYIPEREVTLVTGTGGANKSTFGHQLSICHSAALPMLGVDLARGKALYVTAEDHFDRLHWVHDHICRAVGADPLALVDKLHLSSVRGRINNELATFDSENRIRPTPAFRQLRDTIEATGVSLLVLDNVAHLFAGNENDRAQVTAFINLLYALCVELGVTVLLIAHPNKAGDDWSGSTAWPNAVRSHIVLERPEDSLDPDARQLRVAKANYARRDELLAFRWHDFALVRDEDLPPSVAAELAKVVRDTAANNAFLACLDVRNEQERPVSESPASRTYAPKVFAEMAEAKGFKQPEMAAAMERLFRVQAIERGFIYRDTAEGKDRFGLRRKGSADLSADHPLTGSADYPPTHRRPPPPHTLLGKPNTGAADTAAAPDDPDWFDEERVA